MKWKIGSSSTTQILEGFRTSLKLDIILGGLKSL